MASDGLCGLSQPFPATVRPPSPLGKGSREEQGSLHAVFALLESEGCRAVCECVCVHTEGNCSLSIHNLPRDLLG